MSKIKEFYKTNRIYCILMAVSILCLALIATLFVKYFIEQTKNNNYGNRLNGIDSVKIEEKHITEIEEQIKENKLVDKVSINVKGKIIYMNIYVTGAKYEDVQNIAIKSLEYLKADEKDFYDINFSFAETEKSEESIFPIMGYRKSDATVITWTKVNGE